MTAGDQTKIDKLPCFQEYVCQMVLSSQRGAAGGSGGGYRMKGVASGRMAREGLWRGLRRDKEGATQVPWGHGAWGAQVGGQSPGLRRAGVSSCEAHEGSAAGPQEAPGLQAGKAVGPWERRMLQNTEGEEVTWLLLSVAWKATGGAEQTRDMAWAVSLDRTPVGWAGNPWRLLWQHFNESCERREGLEFGGGDADGYH